jgi:hypothetical protein
MIETTTVFIALTLGGIVHSTAGFGSALVAMPILTMAIEPRIAAPLQSAVGLLLSALIFYRHREAWPWRETLPIIAFSILGIPFGTYALLHFPEGVVLGFMGAVLIAYALFELAGPTRGLTSRPFRRDPHHIGSSIAGFLSGVFGAAYATNGPPVIVYGAVRGWPKGEFKSALQSIFLVNGACIVAWQSSAGLFTRNVGWYALFAVPGLALGAFIGHRIDRRIDQDRFRRYVLGLILILGVVLLARAAASGHWISS